MTSHVTQDIRLLYEAVYDQDLREKADEYNYQVRFEYWVNSLVEEGYDLSDYTWDDMYDIYLDENRMAAYTAGMSDGARESTVNQIGSRFANRIRHSAATSSFARRKKGGRRGQPVEYRSSYNINGYGPSQLPTGSSSFRDFSSTHKEQFDLIEEMLDEANRFEREYNVPNWDKAYNRTARDNPTPRGTSHQTVFRERRPSGEWETGNQTTQRLSKERYSRHRAARGVKTKMREQVDLYDIILSHLLDEGYADTNEDALAIMANMSEEWREDILESFVLPTAEKSRRINTFLNNSLGHLKLYSKQLDTVRQELADKKPPTYNIGKLVKKTNSLSKRMKSARSAVSPRSNIRKFRKDN